MNIKERDRNEMSKKANKVLKKDRMIYYYSVNIMNSADKTSANDRIYTIFNKVFTSFSINNSLRLSSGSDFTTMDILKNDENFLFARVGKIKPTVEIHLRNYSDCTHQDILKPEQEGQFGIEIFTHFLLDYKNGIIGFITGQSAPQPIILNNIVNQYTQEYEMELLNIVSAENVKELLAPGSEISKFSYKFIIPEAGYLEQLNVPDKAIKQLATDEEYEVAIQVRSVKNKKALIFEQEKINDFVNSMSNRFKDNKLMRGLSIGGKTINSRTQDYRLVEQQFNAKVKIAFEINELGQILYNSESFREKVYEVMETKYKKHQDRLILLANKL